MRKRPVIAALALFAVSGCVGLVGDPSGSPHDDPTFVPAEPTLHRLTKPQLHNAWLDLFGKPLLLPSDLPSDDVLYGFSSIAAAQSTISPLELEKYESATYLVLDQVFADPIRRDAFIGCATADSADSCVRGFLSKFATQAFRRPVTLEETTSLLAVASNVGTNLGDAYQGLKYALAAVLLSPHFLFRVEVGEEGPDGYRFTSWEMASRLSFLLTDSPPDDELRASAASGDLIAPQIVRAHAARLLNEPQARATLTRFFHDFMNLGHLDELDKQPDKFPQLSATLGPSMRLEIERLFEENVFEREGDFRDLFTTRETYVNEDLARVYGIEGITGLDFAPITLPDDGRRAGILTTPGFLALNAHKTQTSPTRRGRFIRLNLLCQDIPPPPPGVNTTLPEPDPNMPTTLRQRLDEHRTNPECAGCHARMDPIGFAFEQYDAIGAYRDVDESNLPIDSATDLDGKPVAGPVDMAALIAALPEVGACVARRFYEHGGAHLADSGDQRSVNEVVESFVASDYTFKELVLALVTNNGFRYASPPKGNVEVGP